MQYVPFCSMVYPQPTVVFYVNEKNVKHIMDQ